MPLLTILVVLLTFAGAGVATQAHAQGRWCISSDALFFGNRTIGSSTNVNVTVTNCGDQPWSFTDVHLATGPAFHVSTTCATGVTLAAGQTCIATVQFAPLAPGQTSGVLWLHNTTSTPDQLLTFYGRGVNAAAPAAEAIPTIGRENLALLALVLAVLGWVVTRRRKR